MSLHDEFYAWMRDQGIDTDQLTRKEQATLAAVWAAAKEPWPSTINAAKTLAMLVAIHDSSTRPGQSRILDSTRRGSNDPDDLRRHP